MRPETKSLLEDHKQEFQNYKKFLDKNNWQDDVYENAQTGKLESAKLKTEISIIKTIIAATNKFKEDIGEDIDKKPVQDFIKFTAGIINKHIDGIDAYKKQNPIIKNDSSDEDEETDEVEVEFHSTLFALKTSTKVALTKLKIDENQTSKQSLDLFHSNTKAPLMMREFLYETFPQIKNKVDNLGIDFSKAHINPATSNEMFINMKPKDIPPWDPNKHFFEQEKSTIQFWEEERRKILYGVNIGGYHISPWLYWHLNHFKMALGTGVNKKPASPTFRDNEYFIDKMFRKAQDNGRVGLMMFGSRRYSKSTTIASMITQKMFSVANVKGTIQGYSEKPDLEAIINYISEAVGYMHDALKIPANNMDLKEGAILGLKGKKAQDRFDFSKLSVINLEGGNTKKGGQKTAGATPDIFVFDEALRHNEKVLTDNGFINIGDVKIGDKIYDPSGKLTTVLDKIDVGVKQLYKVELRNGVSIEACGDHQWEVRDKFNKGKIFIKKTSELLKDFKLYGGRSKYSIRKTKPVEFTEKPVTIEPYFLGLWLGDGDKDSATITSIDDYIIDYVEDYSKRIGLGFSKTLKLDPHRKQDTYSVRIIKNKGKTNPLLTNLKDYGIFKNKRIPKEYLFNSVENRLQLLSGILDSDGTINNRNICSITLGKKDLFNDVILLLESLGISAKWTTVYVKGVPYYKTWFTTSLKVFRLPRKLNRQREAQSSKGLHNQEWVSIENIEPTVKDQAYCIKVSNESKLFLTTMFTTTHNCGKGDCITPWNAALPSFDGGENGKFRCTPILCGTSGNSELSKDAETMLKDPETYSILPMDWDMLEEFVDPEAITWKRNNFGMFLPAQQSLAFPKTKINLQEFLKSDNEALSKIDFYNTDWMEAKKFFENKRQAVSKDIAMLASETNFYPLDPEDCYLTTEKNIFPGLECKNRKAEIEREGLTGQAYELWKDSSGNFRADFSNKPTITDYPYKGNSIDAPVVMLENPLLQDSKPPLGLYCIGFDDAKHDQTDGDSVLSATVVKRSFEGGEWANRIVAWYDSRPERKKDYYKVLYMLMKIFNARLLHENDDNGFIEYLEDKYPDDLFIHVSEGIGLASEENLIRNKNRKWGVPANPTNIYNWIQRVVRYTKDENITIGDQEGLSGVDIINHPMLLEELYKYKKKNNADRLRSFSLALTLAQYYDKTYQFLKTRKKEVRDEDRVQKKIKKTSRGLVDTSKLK